MPARRTAPGRKIRLADLHVVHWSGLRLQLARRASSAITWNGSISWMRRAMRAAGRSCFFTLRIAPALMETPGPCCSIGGTKTIGGTDRVPPTSCLLPCDLWLRSRNSILHEPHRRTLPAVFGLSLRPNDGIFSLITHHSSLITALRRPRRRFQAARVCRRAVDLRLMRGTRARGVERPRRPSR